MLRLINNVTDHFLSENLEYIWSSAARVNLHDITLVYGTGCSKKCSRFRPFQFNTTFPILVPFFDGTSCFEITFCNLGGEE